MQTKFREMLTRVIPDQPVCLWRIPNRISNNIKSHRCIHCTENSTHLSCEPVSSFKSKCLSFHFLFLLRFWVFANNFLTRTTSGRRSGLMRSKLTSLMFALFTSKLKQMTPNEWNPGNNTTSAAELNHLIQSSYSRWQECQVTYCKSCQ